MFKKEDRKKLEEISKDLGKINSKLFDKIRLENEIKSLENTLEALKKKKKEFKATEDVFDRKVIIMRTPLRENTPMLYLSDVGGGFYKWSSKRENADTFTFEQAYYIKKDFYCFKDTLENLLIVCVDDLKDDENCLYKSPLLSEIIKKEYE